MEELYILLYVYILPSVCSLYTTYPVRVNAGPETIPAVIGARGRMHSGRVASTSQGRDIKTNNHVETSNHSHSCSNPRAISTLQLTCTSLERGRKPRQPETTHARPWRPSGSSPHGQFAPQHFIRLSAHARSRLRGFILVWKSALCLSTRSIFLPLTTPTPWKETLHAH